MPQGTFFPTWEQAERDRCKSSFVYFCENYMRVKSADHAVPLRLHEYQKLHAQRLGNHKLTISQKFRCGGFTTVECAWSLWSLLFRDRKCHVHVGVNDRHTMAIRNLMLTFLDGIPCWLKSQPTRITAKEIEWDDGRSMLFRCIGNFDGLKACHIFFDEFAYGPWVYGLATLCDNITMTSSFEGIKDDNPFLKLYLAAQVGDNEFFAFNYRKDIVDGLHTCNPKIHETSINSGGGKAVEETTPVRATVEFDVLNYINYIRCLNSNTASDIDVKQNGFLVANDVQTDIHTSDIKLAVLAIQLIDNYDAAIRAVGDVILHRLKYSS